MGVSIHLKLSESITQKEWTAVYERSHIIAEKSGFYDYGKKEVHGENVPCIFPSEEICCCNETGWRVVGSLPSYKGAEDFFMPKTFGTAERISVPYDILYTLVPHKDGDEPKYNYIWGGKTQGEEYHMGLLAIGCVAEQMLGIQALVGGDITYRQCVTAAETASQMLGETIQLPVRCRMQDFYHRIQKFDTLSEAEKLEVFMEYYLGDDNDELGNFLSESYSSDTLTAYWQEQFKDRQIGSYGFIRQMQRYLLLSPNLAGFCSLADFDRTNEKQCEEFVRAVMKSSLHLKEKDCYDPLDLKHYSVPYGVGNLLASIFMRSAVNPAIDRYIPLDEIRAVLAEQLDRVVDVNTIIDDYLSEQENSTKKSGHMQLMDEAAEYKKEEIENRSRYDICDREKLSEYTEKSMLHPKLADSVCEAFQFYYDLRKEPKCRELLQQSADEMFHYLAVHMEYICLTKRHWEKIYDDLHRDKTVFERYYPMIRLNINGEVAYLVRALVENDALWEYCIENYEGEIE